MLRLARPGFIVACVSSLIACSSPSATPSPSIPVAEPSEPAASAAPSGPPSGALEDRAQAEFQIGGADFPLVAFDSVWVVAGDRPVPAVFRIDPTVNEVAAEIAIPGRNCQGTAASPDAVWACSDDGVVRIDPATNEITTIVDVDAIGQSRLAYGAGSVWAKTRAGPDSVGADAVVRIDATTAAPTTTVSLGHVVNSLAFGFDALWVTSPQDGLLLRVDPATNAVTTVVSDLQGPAAIAVGPDSLWVSLFGTEDADPAPGEPSVVRIDPTSGELVAALVTEPLGLGCGIAADASSVWIRGPETFLTHVDPATNTVVETITALQGAGDVTLGFESVWAAAYDFGRLWRVSPTAN
jgi:sugar lactone lactonase YvrE